MKPTFTLTFAVFATVAFVLAYFVHEQWGASSSQRLPIQENATSQVQVTDIMKEIQAQVDVISRERDYQTVTLNNEQFLGQMTDGGGQLVGYFKDGYLKKVVERLGLSYGVMTYEYYFSDGQLVFVKEKEEDFPADNTGTLDYSKLELAFEGNYYFDQGKVINVQTTGKKRVFENEQDNTGEVFLDYAKENIKILSEVGTNTASTSI